MLRQSVPGVMTRSPKKGSADLCTPTVSALAFVVQFASHNEELTTNNEKL
jgi:hypothetical protein